MDCKNIRRATAADAEALNVLMRSSLTYSGMFAAMLIAYVVSPEQIARDEIFVAQGRGQLLGFYSLIVGEAVELDLMFVGDAAQGKGVGNALFRHMRDRARALGASHVKIVSHPPSLGFYERMGAQRVGVQQAAGRITWTRPVLQLEL